MKTLRNIFLLYMPPSNREAMVHYDETIHKRVAPDRIYRYVGGELRRQLDEVFAGRPIAVWGSRDTRSNRSKFEKMRPGDEILIVEGDTIKLLGKVAATTVNADLSRALWKNLQGDSTEGWNLIYFIANPMEIDLPFVEFCRLLGYESNYQLRGFTTVSQPKLEAFYDRYDDLYAVLLLIKRGQASLIAGRESKQRIELCYQQKLRARAAFEPLGFMDNGDPTKTVPWIMNIAINGVDGEAAIVGFKDIVAASTGAACTVKDYRYSHVLEAMSLPHERLRCAIRLSWSHLTGPVNWTQIADRLSDLVL